MNSLDSKLIKIIEKRIEKYPIDFGYLFGSKILGKAGPLSDIDIAVLFQRKLSNREIHKLTLQLLTDLISDLHPLKVDLVCLNKESYLLFDKIVREGKEIAVLDVHSLQSFIENTILRALDFKPFSEQFNKWQKESLTLE